MELYTLMGRSESGKSSFAKRIEAASGFEQTAHLEFRDVVTEFANRWRSLLPVEEDPSSRIRIWIERLEQPLTEFAGLTLTQAQLSDLQLGTTDLLQAYLASCLQDPTLLTDDINPDNKKPHLPLLQWLGSRLVEAISPDIWSNSIIKKITAAQEAGTGAVTVSGARYLRDIERLRDADAFIIKTTRPAEKADGNPTEVEIEQIIPDAIVHTVAPTPELMGKVALRLIRDYRESEVGPGKPLKEYWP